MGRPLFLEGDAGVGKTAFAHALAQVTGRPTFRLQCYEGLEASQALYDWDFPRQLLHLRAVEAAPAHHGHGHARGGPVRPPVPDRLAAAAGPGAQPERAAGRRGRPGRRRVRGVPARGPRRRRGVHSRAGPVRAQTPPLIAPHHQPHPRGARRVEAPLPLPLAAASRFRPRGRDPAQPTAPGDRATGGEVARPPRSCARSTCSSRPASPSPWTGRPRCTPWVRATSTRISPPAPSARAQVPRGHRPRPRLARGAPRWLSVRPAPRDVVDTVLGFARTLRACRGVRLARPRRGDARRPRLPRRPRPGRRLLGGPAHVVRRTGRPGPLRRRVRRVLRRRAAASPRRGPRSVRSCRLRAAGARHRRGRARRARPRVAGQRGRGAAAPRRRRADRRRARPPAPAVRPAGPATPMRPARRRRPGRQGEIDQARTVAAPSATAASRPACCEPPAGTGPRRLVLLLDVSGSMTPYADALLRFGHAAVRARPATTEVFTIGTRLTRVTREMRLRDPDRALAATTCDPRLVGVNTPRRGAQGLPRPVGATRHGPGRGGRGVQRRLGARRDPVARRADGAAAQARARRRAANPQQGAHRLRAADRRDDRRPFPRWTTSCPGTAWPPSRS